MTRIRRLWRRLTHRHDPIECGCELTAADAPRTESTPRCTAVCYEFATGDPVPSGEYFTSRKAASDWANINSHFSVARYAQEGMSPWFPIPASEETLNRKDRETTFCRLFFVDAGQDYPTYHRLVAEHEDAAARRRTR